MFFHELLDAVLISFDGSAHLRADLIVFLAADLFVPPHPLYQVRAIEFRPEDFGHRAVGAAVVLQQFFKPVFGLRVADGKCRRLKRLGEDVRDAVFIAVDRRFVVCASL